MNCHLRFGRAFAALAAVLTMVGARAYADTSTMVGDWRGVGQSAVDGHFIDPCWDIERGAGRRMEGTLQIIVPGELEPCLFPIACIQAGDGSVTGIGADSDHTVLLQGRTRAAGDGSVRITAMAYLLLDARGLPQDLGAMAVMQMIGGQNWEHMAGAPVNGRWQGAYLSRFHPAPQSLEGDLANVLSGERQPTTGIEGSLRFSHVFIDVRTGFLDVPLGVQGTAEPPEPERPSAVGMIGQAEPPDPDRSRGIIAVLIGLQDPPDPIRPSTMRGNYRMYRNVFDLYFETVFGGNRSFDTGAFNLPAVQ